MTESGFFLLCILVASFSAVLTALFCLVLALLDVLVDGGY